MPKIRLSRREAEQGLLPRVCALTGVRTREVKRKTFLWMPPWVYLTLLAGLLPYVIVALVTRKTMTVEVPLIRGKHAHWLVRQLFAVFGLLGSLAVFFVGVALAMDRNRETLGAVLLGVGVAAFFLVLLVAAVLNGLSIRPTEITDRSITLAGVHQNFIDALEEDRERAEEDEEEGDRRRKKVRRDGRRERERERD